MNKSIRYTLYTLGVLVFVLAGTMIYIAATFTPETFKPTLIDYVKSNTNRTLAIDGNVSLSVFPNPKITLNQVSLSEPDSNKEFASINAIHIALQFWPLLSKNIVLDALDLDGIKVHIIKNKNGAFNFEDFYKTSSSTKAATASDATPVTSAAPKTDNVPKTDSAIAVNLSQINITHGEVSYTDQQTNQRYVLSDLSLLGDKITLNQANKVDFSSKVSGSGLEGAWGLTANIDKIERSMQDNSIEIDGSTFTAEGKQADQIIKLKALFPKIFADGNHATTELGDISATVNGEGQSVDSGLKIKGLDVSPQLIAIQSFLLDLKADLVTQQIKASVGSSLNYAVTGNQLLLPELLIRGGVTQVSDKMEIPFDLKGRLDADLNKMKFISSLNGMIDQQKIQISSQIETQKQIPYTLVSVKADQLDLNRYLANKPQTKAQSSSPSSSSSSSTKQSEQAILDLSPLNSLHLDADVAVGKLKYQTIDANNLRLKTVIANGQLKINQLQMNALGGSLGLTGSATTSSNPKIALTPQISGVDMYTLLKTFADFDKIEGKGNVKGTLNFSGNKASDWKKTLSGDLSTVISDGAWRGVNIAKTIRDVKASLKSLKGGEQAINTSDVEKTDFTELSASFQINQGIARNQDLNMKSPLLRISGEGEVSLPAGQINYLLNTDLVNTSKGQQGKERDELTGVTVPIRIKGPLAKPSYSLDVASLIKQTGNAKLNEKKAQLEQKLTDKLNKKVGSSLGTELKKLF